MTPDLMCSCHLGDPIMRALGRENPRAYVKRRAFDLDIHHDQIIGPNRSRRIAYARAIIASELREQGLSYPEIGRALGKDHSSVIYMVKLAARLKAQP